jgi:hypothetical protein
MGCIYYTFFFRPREGGEHQMAKNNSILKPGQVAPQSGQYSEVGPRGGKVSTTEVTIVQGNTVPPTHKPGNGYTMVDPTVHKK